MFSSYLIYNVTLWELRYHSMQNDVLSFYKWNTINGIHYPHTLTVVFDFIINRDILSYN